MVEKNSVSRTVFLIFNYVGLTVLALICLFPILHVLSISLSSAPAASSGKVTFWPVEFQINSYLFVIQNEAFLASLFISIKRVLLGTSLQMLLIVLLAYPLSKEAKAFPLRTLYAWYFFITLLFSGGLIPTYMTVQKTGLLDSLGALVIPNAVPVFSVVLMLNFFRGLPKELEEAAFIDGAGHWKTLAMIFVPLSKPALATLLLFSIVGHWNAWFDGIIYMNQLDHYPFQSYLQTIVIAGDNVARSSLLDQLMSTVSERTIKSAQIFLGALPVLVVYPFLQRYFMKGIVLGSVKG